MIKIEMQRDIALLRGQIASLHELFLQQENVQSAQRAKDLAIKLEKQEYAIAFCGHFSAGKSSMINRLMGENLLPSSPIPTSANLVKIKSGEDYAKVMFKEDRPRLYPAPYDYEKVKSYCKDGDQIESIEISYSNTLIPKDTIIMDTPGIDSTDDAHRIATESALHLADLVFYVMDYNHVQSELNFLFTKELTEAGKKVFLVINQIDKHREEELSFVEFQESVKKSFATWGVNPARIFYTSLKAEDHTHNQFAELRQFIHDQVDKRLYALPESIFQSLKKLGEEHKEFLSTKNQSEYSKYHTLLDELSDDERKSLPDKVTELTAYADEMSHLPEKSEQELYAEMDHILDSAYLMPFQTRDLAEQYLATRQPDFKMGLFFTKQKTENERAERLNRFYTDFAEKVTSQIDWHVKELLLKVLKENRLEDEKLLEIAQNFAVHFDKGLLESIVKSGARLSGDYVLNYTKDLTDSIKSITKKQLASFKEEYVEQLKVKQKQQKEKLEKELSGLTHYLMAQKKIDMLIEQQTQFSNQLENVLAGQIDVKALQEKANRLALHEEEGAEVVIESAFVKENNPKQETKKRPVRNAVESKKSEYAELDGLISSLQFASHEVKDLPGFKKIADELMQKAERLENQSFTVALFGAFSAGKSSFANALLGERLLPVSPNPTTAAINKIMPIDDVHPHGTVLVKLKSYDTLMEDVNRSLAAFDQKANSIDSAISSAQTIISNKNHVDAYEKMHLAFLQAFIRGISAYTDKLGEMIESDLTGFSGFVANEEQSCLVEWIEVYYNCELTRKGVTLVDTPGADSINARHTGVAFEYIKNSDAILFVTYYNHAFSKADREFLIQLGRVKDTFALDKMFFIVNAIDLAQDEEEMNAVLDYVEDQLVTYGIRKPHLFPISSLQSLKEKLSGQLTVESGISLFEQHFYTFIEHDLREIVINTAKLEWKRMLKQLQSFIHDAQSDQETKEKKRIQLGVEKEQLIALIHQPNNVIQKKLTQETDELVFYIKQRVFLRFSDFLKEAFNPVLLKEDGRNLKKALQSALDSFLEDFGYDFAQELRATTLRIEAFSRQLLSQTENSLIAALQEKNLELSFSLFEIDKWESIQFETAFVGLDQQRFKKALSYFKNPKSFFEKNERRFLSEELEGNLQQPADEYLKEEKERIIRHYGEQLEVQFHLLQKYLTEQLEEYYEGTLAALSNVLSIDELRAIENKLVSGTEKGQI